MRNHLKADPDTDRGVLRTVEDAMNATYTPGPWHMSMRPGPIVYGALGEQIADCRAPLQYQSTNGYNARLIAEAPAMADALRQLLADVANGSLIIDHGDRHETQRDVDNARALLARIDGTADQS